MWRNYVTAAVAALIWALPSQGQERKDKQPDSTQYQQSIGLVLSGGGAKGIAHIGVIQALEENNIPIDYVTGTSMGAIVGGLYACGYTPKEMLDLILSKPFSYWSTGQIDPDESFYFASEPHSPVMLTVPLATRKDSLENVRSAVPASVISPMPMNFAFMELFAPFTAQCGGDFNNLFVPFRCVASDVAAKHKVVLDHGDVGYSIRASMSFPIVFQPTQIDSMLLYDGGLYDNFPADVMNEVFAPDFLLGMDVSTEAVGPQTSLMDQLDNLVVQSSSYYLNPENGIKIRFDLNQFGLLDFPQAKQIYKIGYDKTMEMMDSIKGRVKSRISSEDRELRRRVFKSQTPEIRFSSVNVHGASPSQNKYIEYLFNGNKNDTIDVRQARSAYYRALSPGKLRDLVPHALYDDTTGLFSLDLKASVKDNYKLGFGGYVSSSTSSYVYLSAGYSTLSFNSVSANIGAWLGQSYLGGLFTSRVFLHTPIPSALELEAVVFRQKYYDQQYLFFEHNKPGGILNHQYFGRLKWAWACGPLADMSIGGGYGYTQDSFYPTIDGKPSLEKDHNKFSIGEVFLRLESSTLDDINFPTTGHLYQASLMGMMGFYRHHQGEHPDAPKENVRWIQFENITRNYFSFSRHFSLGLESDVILSSRKLLHSYDATMVAAPAFTPTPATYNTFNPAFRSYSFIGAGIVPIYKLNSNIAARIQGYCFMPLRKIGSNPDGTAYQAGKWISHPEFFGEFDITYKLPFAMVAAYCNYSSKPSSEWNVGISFGVFLPAPRYLR